MLTLSFALALALPGYHQHPTVHGQRLVFQAEGDLWLASTAGGMAERLTSHLEIETQPALSPDGQQVAFLGGYDGGREVYVMPVDGGAPKRITYEDAPLSVEGWTPSGRVLFSSGAVVGPPMSRVLRAIDPATLAVDEWPLANANQGATGPAGQRVFTRFGAHTRGDHAHAYRGGSMAQLWSFQPGADEATRLLPDHDGNLMNPMWVGERLYFLSDVSGRYNLHSTDGSGADLRQHTRYDTFDVRRPDSDGVTIVFQLGADVLQFDPASERAAVVELEIRSDLDDARRRWVADPLDYPSELALAPSGQRVAVTARGQIALVGNTDTPRVVLPLPDGVRARGARLSPDDTWVYAIVAVEGQEEVVRLRADGTGEMASVTAGTTGRVWHFVLSPDGEQLVYSDSKGHLILVDVDSGEPTLLASEPTGDNAFDMVFSPGGGLLAYSRNDASRAALHLVDLASGRDERVASDRFSAHSPAFSPDGDWLWFLSDRHFRATPGSPWGDRNMGPAFLGRGGVYGLALTSKARFPFLPASMGEVKEPPDDAAAGETKRKKRRRRRRRKAPEPTRVVWDGLAERLYEVPVRPGDYRGLAANDRFLYVHVSPVQGEDELMSIEIGVAAETERFAEGLDGFALSANGRRLLVHSDDSGVLVKAGSSLPDDLESASLDLDGWRLAIDPAAEWLASFDDAWRMHADHAFDPNLRGVDWDAVHERLAPLAARVTHRGELDDVLGLMAAELGILHSQVRGAELPRDEEGGRGATLAIETRAVDGGLEIVRRYDGDPDLLDERSPLARPEVDVGIGDVLVSLDGRPLRSNADLVNALTDRSGRQIRLGVEHADGRSRTVHVVPVPGYEVYRRRYRHWEQTARARVDAESDGTIGYVHLRAMSRSDVADFAREYFAVSDRPGLIVDVRGNSGGNIDSWLIGELSRTAWAYWQTPVGEEAHGFTNMQRSFRGHLVVLIDDATYSDGETFAAGIKALDLGPLVGTRTAGAGVWLSDRNLLADGGRARVGEYAQFDLEGRWIVEGHGVGPDVEVVNLPHATWKGTDAQLERAVELLRARIEAEPVPVLRGQPIPPVGTPASDVRRGSGR